jgi:hypothetical protein
MKRKLPQHAAPIGLAVGILLVAVIGWVAVVSPQRSKATDLQAQIDQTQAEVVSRQLQPSGPSAGHKTPIKVADVFRLSKAIPDKLQIADVLLELNRVAGESGITFTSISPHAAVLQTNYSVIPIDVVFRGHYYELTDFLYRLRNLVEVHDGYLRSTGRLFAVDKVGFTEGEVKFPLVQASLTIDAFVYGGVVLPGTPGASGASTSTSTTSTPTTTNSVTTPPAAPTAAAAPGAGS